VIDVKMELTMNGAGAGVV